MLIDWYVSDDVLFIVDGGLLMVWILCYICVNGCCCILISLLYGMMVNVML